jgi:hypothetical protein
MVTEALPLPLVCLLVYFNVIVGPLFDEAEEFDFYNLELSDTNVVDHNTHDYNMHGTKYTVLKC